MAKHSTHYTSPPAQNASVNAPKFQNGPLCGARLSRDPFWVYSKREADAMVNPGLPQSGGGLWFYVS